MHKYLMGVRSFSAYGRRLSDIGCSAYPICFLAWAWLAKAKGHSCHTKYQLLPKHLRKKNEKMCEVLLATTLQKRPVKITVHLGLDNIIKLKFTSSFDRCEILNVLNYLNKNFEPYELIHNKKLVRKQ